VGQAAGIAVQSPVAVQHVLERVVGGIAHVRPSVARRPASFASPNLSRSRGEADAGGVTMPSAELAAVVLDELVLHGWDLARATGQALLGLTGRHPSWE